MILKAGDQFDQVIHLGAYHPYNHGANPKFDEYSRKILDLKESKNAGFDFFEDSVTNLLGNKKFAIAVVPSSTAGKISGITEFASNICKKLKLINATSCLNRHTSVLSSHSGGMEGRSQKKHLDSIKVINDNLIKDQYVLLIDDVTTSGNSLAACKKLLLDSGAKNVQCLALAKTITESVSL